MSIRIQNETWDFHVVQISRNSLKHSPNLPKKFRANQICRKNQHVNAGVGAPGVEEEVKKKSK